MRIRVIREIKWSQWQIDLNINLNICIGYYSMKEVRRRLFYSHQLEAYFTECYFKRNIKTIANHKELDFKDKILAKRY